jgi:metal-sulfur cluster biosynthetic enzyme
MSCNERLLGVLREVIDPEVGVNIVDLGLVYEAEVDDGRILVRMTMTTPACPLGAYITETAEAALRAAFPEVQDVGVDLIWDPPWGPERMTRAAREQLGWAPEPDAE